MDRVGQPAEALTILAIVAAVAAPGWYFSALAIVWPDYVILSDKGISIVAPSPFRSTPMTSHERG